MTKQTMIETLEKKLESGRTRIGQWILTKTGSRITMDHPDGRSYSAASAKAAIDFLDTIYEGNKIS